MKYLGQHFLINKNKIKKIIEALDLKQNETIIEIGPGHGEITENLKSQIRPSGDLPKAKTNLKIFAIEKDHSFVLELQKKFALDKNIEIIEGDALKILPELTQNSKLITHNYKLIGNIPYYITGYLFRILAELKNKPSLTVFTIQKEVAQRVCVKPPKMNLLAASIQFWAEPKIISYISKNEFRPRPKVDSAIIRLLPARNYANFDADLRGKYYKFIKILFKQPRKTILNNLKLLANTKLITQKLKSAGINPQDRPQNLTIEQIKKFIGGDKN